MHQPQDARIHRLAGETMGTRWSLRLANADFLPLEDVRGLVQSVLDAVIAQMSNWDARSVISEFNRLPAGDWLELPPAFSRVLSAALEWARRSGGALDPTMGALVSLWGFGPRADPLAPHSGVAPSAEVIASTLAVVGFDRLERLDLSAESVRIRQSGGLQLDLCGIAKGFAVDEVVLRLQQAGWAGGLFEIGGELRSWGTRPDGSDWRVQLGGSSEPVDSPLVVAVQGGAFATSGDYWHHFAADGRRYSHTLDPRTGWPIEHALASVTVHHRECMHADALATVLTVLGPNEGMAFAQDNDIAAVMWEHGSAVPLVSAAWKARFAS